MGSERIAGALNNVGHHVSDQTVGNVLRRHSIEPAPKRGQSTSWSEFIRTHMDVLAGIDFFTVEVLRWSGLATYYVLFLIHLESRRVTIARITRHPTETWMEQLASNVTDASTGCRRDICHVLHDRDSNFCASSQSILTAAGVKCLKLPARSPNLNAFAERWVRSGKEECLSSLILFGEGSLNRALTEFVEHFHAERPDQGKGNGLLFPTQSLQQTAAAQMSADSGSAACFDTTVVLHDFLDPTRLSRFRFKIEESLEPGNRLSEITRTAVDKRVPL